MTLGASCGTMLPVMVPLPAPHRRITSERLSLALAILVIGGLACFFPAAAPAVAGDPPPAASKDGHWHGTGRSWAGAPAKERADLESFLREDAWPLRAIALMRLERYTGAGPRELILTALGDDAWQVRVFAILAATRAGIGLTAAELDAEVDPRVRRVYHRAGVTTTALTSEDELNALLRSRMLDDRLLAIELAAWNGDEAARTRATRVLIATARDLDSAEATIYGRQLATLMDVRPMPRSLGEFKTWLRANARGFTLPQPATRAASWMRRAPSTFVEMEHDTLLRLRDYLAVLSERDLDLAIVIDATGSMQPLINAVRAEIDAIIRFRRDLSRTFRLAVIAYRDDVDRRPLEQQRLTEDVDTVRRFLLKLKAEGGGDIPESVVRGIAAAGRLKWSEEATRRVIIVGDAPPHAQDASAMDRMLDELAGSGCLVSTVALRQTDRDLEPVADLEDTFRWLAERGGGQATAITEPAAFVKSVNNMAIEEGWHEVFDSFYRLYHQMCHE